MEVAELHLEPNGQCALSVSLSIFKCKKDK